MLLGIDGLGVPRENVDFTETQPQVIDNLGMGYWSMGLLGFSNVRQIEKAVQSWLTTYTQRYMRCEVQSTPVNVFVFLETLGVAKHFVPVAATVYLQQTFTYFEDIKKTEWPAYAPISATDRWIFKGRI